jgi:pilus assembly protein CpaF
MEGDTIVMQDIFQFDYSMGVDAEGCYLGHLKSTGLRPKFAENLEYMGIEMEPGIFAPEPMGRG